MSQYLPSCRSLRIRSGLLLHLSFLALAACQAAPPPTLPPAPSAAGKVPATVAATATDADASATVAATAALAALPPEHVDGEAQFNALCAACHGPGAMGSDQGPPLVHRIYEPGHHGNAAFVSAVVNGVTAHHWDFGDMPPVEGITGEQIRAITLYVRWLQEQNGIR